VRHERGSKVLPARRSALCPGNEEIDNERVDDGEEGAEDPDAATDVEPTEVKS
jgi:hypothetical protein